MTQDPKSAEPLGGKTYAIGEQDGQPFIRCLRCRLASFHPKDIEQRYCARCHRWHKANPDALRGGKAEE